MKYKKYGFKVLGFNCNQFKGEEPGFDSYIKKWYFNNYKVTFPLFKNVLVKGWGCNPLWAFMAKSTKYKVKGNWTKFLIDRRGFVVKRFEPKEKPMSFLDSIVKVLNREKEMKKEKSFKL